MVEKESVRGEGEVGAGVLAREQRDEVGKIFSEEGFAAGESDFLGAEANEDGGEARNFFVGKNERAREEGVVRAKDLARHTIRAAEVTTVCDGDAEIPEVSAEEVC